MEILYILFILLALIVNYIANYKQLIISKIEKKNTVHICLIVLICSILGSKLLDILVNFNNYLYYDYIEAIQTGYMFYGAFILSSLYTFLYCKIKGVNYKTIFEITIPNILLFCAICKLGCHFNNCCTGINGTPIQLVESINCFVIYLLILKFAKGFSKIHWTCISFALIRSFSFLVRDNWKPYNLEYNLIISFIVFLFGMNLLIKYHKSQISTKKST